MSSFRRLENRTGCIRQNATLARRVGRCGDEAGGAHHSSHRSEQASPDGFSGPYPVSEQDRRRQRCHVQDRASNAHFMIKNERRPPRSTMCRGRLIKCCATLYGLPIGIRMWCRRLITDGVVNCAFAERPLIALTRQCQLKLSAPKQFDALTQEKFISNVNRLMPSIVSRM